MAKKIIKIIGISTLLFLNGCMHETKILTPTKSNILKGKTVSFIPLDTATHPTHDDSYVGLSVDVALLSALLHEIEENTKTHSKYLYPTGILGQKSINALENKYGMIYKSSNEKTDYKLEVKTYWYSKGAMMSFNKRQLYMENDIRLKDAKSDKVIAQAFCQYTPLNINNIPRHDSDKVREPNSKIVKNMSPKIFSK